MAGDANTGAARSGRSRVVAALCALWRLDPETPRAERDPFPVVAVLAFGLLVAQKPALLVHPYLWAEDGVVFFAEHLVYGLGGTIWLPHAGYIEPLARVLAALAGLLPLRAVPIAYAALSLALAAIACAWFSRATYRRLVAHDGVRAAACLTVASVPVACEITGNLANLHTYLLWLGYLSLMAPLPVGNARRAGVILLWAAIGFAGPGGLLLLPIWALRILVRADAGERWVAVACILPAILTGLTLDDHTRPAIAEGAVSGTGVARLIAWRVLAGPFVGEVFGPAATGAGFLVPALGALAIGLAVAVVAARGTTRERAWLVVTLLAACLIMAGTIAGRPGIVATAESAPMGWGGGRYFWPPVNLLVLIFFVAWSVARGVWRGALAATILAVWAVALLGVGASQACPGARGWTAHTVRLRQAMAARRSCTIAMPIAPPGWSVRLDLVEGRPAPAGSRPGPSCD